MPIEFIERYFNTENESDLDTLLRIKTGFNDVENQAWKNRRNFGYEPTEYLLLFKLFKRYPFSLEDVFVDYGAGLGRVLIVAVMFGCKNAIGIEIDKATLALCKKNVAARNGEREIKIEMIPAEKWNPIEGVNKVFFFNPFSAFTFAKVLKKLINYSRESEQEVLLFFAGLQPGYLNLLDECPGVLFVEIIKGSKYDLHIFRLKMKQKLYHEK